MNGRDRDYCLSLSSQTLPTSVTRPPSKVQVTLPPRPIQLGPERIYRHTLYLLCYLQHMYSARYFAP